MNDIEYFDSYVLRRTENTIRGFSANDPQIVFIMKNWFIKKSVAEISDVIVQNESLVQTQSIKISLIDLEYPGRFWKRPFWLSSVMRPVMFIKTMISF